LFFAAGPSERIDKISYWLWILLAYLVTLGVETAVLAKAAAPRKREVSP
jgi:hypothetical protein